MEHVYDMIIIGGGPAGYTAALYAARAGLDTVLIEKAGAGGQMALTDVIDNYPGFDEGIDGFTLGMKMKSGAERFGVKTILEQVNSVNFKNDIKSVNTSKNIYYSRTVVISTGADPNELGIKNEREYIGKGIHYCAHCDGRFYKDKTVMVIGGGNTAVADALFLARFAKKFYVVHRRNAFRAEKILVTPLLNAKNVEVLWNSVPTEFTAEERINGAIIKNIETQQENKVEADGIFVSIGRKPVTDIFDGAVLLDDKGYIVADETCRTNIDGVYAVGDVRTKPLRQIITAAADGAVAVHFAAEYLSGHSDF